MTYPRASLVSLVDSTGRVSREDKRGYIPGETPQILERLNIDPEQFIATPKHFSATPTFCIYPLAQNWLRVPGPPETTQVVPPATCLAA